MFRAGGHVRYFARFSVAHIMVQDICLQEGEIQAKAIPHQSQTSLVRPVDDRVTLAAA